MVRNSTSFIITKTSLNQTFTIIFWKIRNKKNAISTKTRNSHQKILYFYLRPFPTIDLVTEILQLREILPS